jgi:hypothetical protein
MFALSTDRKKQPNKDEPSGDSGYKASRTSLQEIELEKLVDSNGHEQQV